MKINQWSVVKSPIGLSLRHIKDGKIDMHGEICVSFAEEGYDIRVYADGVDPAVATMFVLRERLAPHEPKPKLKRKRR